MTSRLPQSFRPWLSLIAAWGLLVTPLSAAAAQTVVDTDFGSAREPIRGVNGQPSPPDEATGVLPEGWVENVTHYRDVRFATEVVEEQSNRFLRIDVASPEGFQFNYMALPDLPGRSHYRLRVRFRGDEKLLRCAVRQGESPWKVHWEKRWLAGPQWRTADAVFELNAPGRDGPVWLQIGAQGAGRIDLDRVTLERVTLKQLTEEIARAHPGGGPANVMRHSRFPLGLPAGWSYSPNAADGEEVVIRTDAEVVGPSGSPALLIDAPAPIAPPDENLPEAARRPELLMLQSEPIQLIAPTLEHGFAFAVRGQGRWTVEILPTGRPHPWGVKPLGSTTIELDEADGWQRRSVVFTPDVLSPVVVAQFTGTGRLWLDALQCGPASMTDTFTPPAACEVALAVPAEATGDVRIQFDDDPAALDYAVQGDTSDAVLTGRVFDLYGDSKPLKDIPLRGGAAVTGRLDVPLDRTRPYGTFRVEAWVVRDGQRVSPTTEVVFHRLRRPRYFKEDAPDSFFGTHLHSTRRAMVMAKAVGINWARLHDVAEKPVDWYMLEPKPGQWRFRDAEIMRFRDHHIQLLGRLATAPIWASHLSDRPQAEMPMMYFRRYARHRDMSDYVNYVKTVVERYRGVIAAYNVGNEPWQSPFFYVDCVPSAQGSLADYEHGPTPREDFAAVMKASYDAIKAADPDATVVSLSSNIQRGDPDVSRGHFIPGSAWTAGVVEAQGHLACDVLDYHHYSRLVELGYPGDKAATGYDNAVGGALSQPGFADTPVWVTEANAAFGNGVLFTGFYRHTTEGLKRDANWLIADLQCRMLISMMASGVDRVFFYSMSKGNGWVGLAGSHASDMVCADGSLHPAGAAVAALAWRLEDMRFDRVECVAEGMYAYRFVGDGRQVIVLSDAPGAAAYTLPEVDGAQWTDLFGNPVRSGTEHPGRLVYLEAAVDSDVLERL